MVWAEAGGSGGEKPQLKIPEQRMKEELAKILPEERKECEATLHRMNFETNPRNILTMHRIHKSSEEIAHMISYYLFEDNLPALSSKRVIKTSEHLERFADGLEGAYKTLKSSSIFKEDGGTIACETIGYGLPLLCKEGKIKDAGQAVSYIKEIFRLYESVIKAGEDGRFLQAPLFGHMLPALVEAGAINKPDDIAKFRDPFVKFTEVALKEHQAYNLYDTNLPIIIETIVKSKDDFITVATALSNRRTIECARSLMWDECKELKKFKLETPEKLSEHMIAIYFKSEFPDLKIEDIQVFLSDEKLDKICVSELMDYRKTLNSINLEVSEGNILTLHRIRRLYEYDFEYREMEPYIGHLADDGFIKSSDGLRDVADLFVLAKKVGCDPRETFDFVGELKERGTIKTQDEFIKVASTFIRLSRQYIEVGIDSATLVEGPILALMDCGTIKTSDDVLKSAKELLKLCESASKNDLNPYDLILFAFQAVADKGILKSIDDIMKVGEEIIRIGVSCNKEFVDPNYIFVFVIPTLLDKGVIKTLEDLKKNGDEIVKNVKSFQVELGVEDYIPNVQKLGYLNVKSLEDIILVSEQLGNNQAVADCLVSLSSKEISRLNLQNLPRDVIETGYRKVLRLVRFPEEKVTPEQREQLARMVSGLDFLEQYTVIQIFLRHGLKNTFQQLYDSMKENQEALQQMKDVGINRDVYVYHKGIEKLIFKKTLTGLERLEAGEEQIRKTFEDVTGQLFNNPKGEVFKRPTKVFSEITKLDARQYSTPQERTNAITEMMHSKDKEWLGEALLALERNLKTVESQQSTIVGSGEMQREAKIALFHVLEMKRLQGMKAKPLTGEKSEVTISVQMSDKNPLTILTIGNDAGCCMALNGENKFFWQLYLKDMTIQIAEIFVTKEGKEKRVGPAWLFAGKMGGKPTLVIDSIDITSSYRNMMEVYEATINYLMDYAEKAGFKKVVMGTYFNHGSLYAEGKFKERNRKIMKINTSQDTLYTDVLHDKSEGTPKVYIIKE